MHALRLRVRENVLRDPSKVTAADYRLRLDRGDGAWVCTDAREILGFACVDLQDRSVWALFVAPEHEGRGIGRLLHQTLVDWAFAKQLPDLRLSTEQGTRAAMFYERAGWELVRDMGNGDWEFHMTRGRWRSFSRAR